MENFPKLTEIILADKLKAHLKGILIPENFLLLTKAISPPNQAPTEYILHNSSTFHSAKSPTLIPIFPLPVLSPVELHFGIKIGVCFLRCEIVGKNLHICVCLFQHFTRWLGSRSWKNNCRAKKKWDGNSDYDIWYMTLSFCSQVTNSAIIQLAHMDQLVTRRKEGKNKISYSLESSRQGSSSTMIFLP